MVNTIAGTGEYGYNGDGGLAQGAQLALPFDTAVGQDGNIYIADQGNNRIRKIDKDGIITTIAGTGEAGYSGDEDPAIDAALWFPSNMTMGTDGSIYIADAFNNSIRRVNPDGIITTLAGTGEFGFSGDKSPAYGAKFKLPTGVAFGPDGRLRVLSNLNNWVLEIAPPFLGISINDVVIASGDGMDIYIFDNLGRHSRTLNILTGVELLEFTYDTAGILQSIKDGYGNVTTIERDDDGNPAGEAYGFEYTKDGLMTAETSPNGFTSRFNYDDGGWLVKDEDAAGGSTGLERSHIEGGFNVTARSALGRTSIFEVKRFPNVEMHMTGINPAGQKYEGIEEPNGKYTIKYANGSQSVMMLWPDKRFGMQVSVIKELSLIMPSGLTSKIKAERTTVVSDPENVLSLIRQEDRVDFNGQIYESVYDAEELLQTFVTPEGRHMNSATMLWIWIGNKRFHQWVRNLMSPPSVTMKTDSL